MSSFTRAIVEPTGRTVYGRVEFRVVAEFTYEVGYLGSGWKITVPEGFIFDGPSVPFYALPFSDVGKMFKSSAIHDWLIADGKHPRELCDLIFKEALAVEGLSLTGRLLAYWAVRWNGITKRSAGSPAVAPADGT